jgi:hypothetical protein
MKKYTYYFLFFLLLSIKSIGQKEKDISLYHHEVPNDAYIFVSRNSMLKSPAYTFRSSTIFTTQVNIDAGGNNIVGDAGNEPSIAIDPTNPNRIIIGWRQFDDINNDFRQAGYAFSTDAGNSWTFPGPIDAGIFRSDPVLDSDANGNFYYNSLGVDGGMHCDVYKIDDGGVAWDSGTYAYGGDKQWMRIDKTDGIGEGNNYSFWSSSYSDCSGSFTRSTNYGDSYENCISVDGDPRWGTLAVGKEGELYIAGTGLYPITLIKSSNAKDSGQSVTWDFTKSVDLNGYISVWDDINPVGLVGQVWVATDISTGVGEGNVYVMASVRRTSSTDPADVMFARSTDGGNSFEAPIRINTDTSQSNYQWLGTMAIAPNGRIDIIWLDTRDAPSASPHHSALYYSFSIDQGDTWSENQQVSDYFDPHIGYPQQQKMGDYFDMKSDNDGAHLAWSNTLNGGEDVYYSHITPDILSVEDAINSKKLLSLNLYPNPFIEETTILYTLEKELNLTIDILDIFGNVVKTLKQGSYGKGHYKIKWEGKNDKGTKLTNALYFIRLKTEKNIITKKILLHY